MLGLQLQSADPMSTVSERFCLEIARRSSKESINNLVVVHTPGSYRSVLHQYECSSRLCDESSSALAVSGNVQCATAMHSAFVSILGTSPRMTDQLLNAQTWWWRDKLSFFQTKSDSLGRIEGIICPRRLSVTGLRCTKTAKRIEVLFGLEILGDRGTLY